LTEWEKLIRNFHAKMEVVKRISGNNPRRSQILTAMTTIIMEFDSIQLKNAKC